MEEFIHPVLNEEVDAIGGHYVLTKEKTLLYKGRKILYYIGYGVVDTSCCGATGCGYAVIPGYIYQWHIKETPDTGQAVTLVEPIEKELQENVAKLIKLKAGVMQVHFLLDSGDKNVFF